MAAIGPAPVELIGRDADLAEVSARIGPGRLVTIVGPGGVGKTSLAAAALRWVADRFDGDIAFVSCAETTTGDQLHADAVGGVLPGLPPPDSPGRLAALLGDRRPVLLLDNLEQVRGARDAVARLRAAVPRLALLATSRTPIGAADEDVLPLAPLRSAPSAGGAASRDEPDAPAVRLFLRRARQAYPDLRLTPEQLDAAGTLCARLDGLPLAIELAAARIAVLSPVALLSRLERRPDLLRRDARDPTDRHRSLTSTIAWSHDLLSPAERRLFRRLAMFAGPFDVEAAAAVTGDRDPGAGESADDHRRYVLAGLDGLVRSSLVQALPGGDGGTIRFAILETIRVYAADRLAEEPDREGVERLFVDWAVARAEQVSGRLNGPDLGAALADIDASLPSLRHAVEVAERSGAITEALRLAVALWRYWEVRGLVREGASVLGRLLARADASTVRTDLLATALNHHANLLTDLGAWREAIGPYARSLTLRRAAGRAGPIADTLNNLGLVAAAMGDQVTAGERFLESLAIRRQTGDRWGAALALGNLGDIAVATGDAAGAIRLHAECLAIRRAIGDARGIAFGLSNLAEASRLAGDPDRAAALLDEAGARMRDLALPFGQALVARNRGDVARDLAQPSEAIRLWSTAAAGFDGIGDDGQLAEVMDRLAAGLVDAGRLRDGAIALAVTDRLRSTSGLARPPVLVDAHARTVAAVMTLGEIALAAAGAQASVMTGSPLREWLEAIGASTTPAGDGSGA